MPKRQPGEPISDCVARAMSVMADEPKYKDLNQNQMLGRAYGICKEMQKDQAFTTSSSGAYNPRFSAPKCKKCGKVQKASNITDIVNKLKREIRRHIDIEREDITTTRDSVNYFFRNMDIAPFDNDDEVRDTLKLLNSIVNRLSLSGARKRVFHQDKNYFSILIENIK